MEEPLPRSDDQVAEIAVSRDADAEFDRRIKPLLRSRETLKEVFPQIIGRYGSRVVSQARRELVGRGFPFDLAGECADRSYTRLFLQAIRQIEYHEMSTSGAAVGPGFSRPITRFIWDEPVSLLACLYTAVREICVAKLRSEYRNARLPESATPDDSILNRFPPSDDNRQIREAQEKILLEVLQNPDLPRRQKQLARIILEHREIKLSVLYDEIRSIDPSISYSALNETKRALVRRIRDEYRKRFDEEKLIDVEFQ